MRKYFFLLLFIAVVFGFLTVARAQDATGATSFGSYCGNRGTSAEYYNEVCEGNSVIRSLYCSVDKDKCQIITDQMELARKTCNKIITPYYDVENCQFSACSPKSDACYSECLKNSNVNKTFNCNDVCDAAEKTCNLNCINKFEELKSCEKQIDPLYKKREQCLGEMYWLPVSQEEKDNTAYACRDGFVCVPDPKFIYRAHCVEADAPTSKKKSPADDFWDKVNKIGECHDEVDKKFGLYKFDRGCKDGEICDVVYKCYQPFSPAGFWEECMAKGAPEVFAGYQECNRKYPVDGAPTKSTVPVPVVEAPSDLPSDSPPPDTVCKAVPTEQNSADAVEKEDKNLQKALAHLNKIKQSGDERATDHAIEDELALLDKDSKKRIETLRGMADDIHEIASNGVGWQEFPKTIESIKKGEFGSYGKLELATDVIKSFNDYNNAIAGGEKVEDAAAEALLNNFGSTALTAIPVLGAIDLVAKTPSIILDIFDIDEKNWLRKNITDGIIAKFSPSGVVEQTTELMLENDWSTIGGALSYQWGKVRSADGAWATTKESGKLVAGGIGAGAVSIARTLRDTTAGTIFVGKTAANCVSNWFGY